MSERDFLRWRPDDEPRVPSDELEVELDRVVARGLRRKARRTTAIGGTLALLLVMGIAVAVSGPDGEPSGVTAADNGSTTTSTVDTDAPITTTTVPQHPRPPFVVVARDVEYEEGTTRVAGSEIALLDPDSGKTIRTIYRTGGGIYFLALSNDRRYVYFAQSTCGAEPIDRIRVDGPAEQTPERINDISSEYPTPSPDGNLVAYVGYGDCDGESGPANAVRVRNLATRQETTVAIEPVGYSLSWPTWSPDGTKLAVVVKHTIEHPSTSPEEPPKYEKVESFVALLDPHTTQDPLTAPRLLSLRTGFGFDFPTHLPDGSLFLVEVPLGDKVGTAAPLMLVIDGRSGSTRRQVALGDPKRSYSHTASDVTGSHLLYVSASGDSSELRVSSNGGKTTVLARNVTAADW